MEIITDVKHLFDAFLFAAKRFDIQELWWRGHSDSTWNLIPRVYQKKGGLVYERNIATRFMLRARAVHGECPNDEDMEGWRFLMQHYRLPTRLLDWSASILVAAFFAVNEHPDKDGALWVLNPYELNRIFSGQAILFHPKSVRNLLTFTNVDKVAAIAPMHLDVRMMIQSSFFTIHGNKTPLNSYEDSGRFLYKFVIPARLKGVIRGGLELVGIKESFLFPGLEYLAKELSGMTYLEKED
jgi:hypothetical protein